MSSAHISRSFVRLRAELRFAGWPVFNVQVEGITEVEGLPVADLSEFWIRQKRALGGNMKHTLIRKFLPRLAASAVVMGGWMAGVANAADVELRVGTVLPEEHPVVKGFEKLNELASERSGGTLEVLVYPNGQLGNTQDMMDQALLGANVASFTDAARLATFVPKLGVIGAPYVFNTYEEADAFVTSEKFDEWAEELREESGYVVLSFNWYQGPRYLLTKKPIASRADMEGVRIRTPGAPAWVAAGKALGGTPTPLAWAEIYGALQLGAIDAAEAGPAATMSMKFNEVASHLTKTGHIHLITGLVVGEEWWNTLTEVQQKALKSASLDAGRYMSELNNKADAEAINFLAENGMTVSEIDTGEFVDAAKGELDALGLGDAYSAVRATLDAQ